ncbi:hypothetical protein BSL78_05209 [Apostichopus japonicus]|uniref:Uncharacterized protein n=1 Tax=Stichopus japonicus TaxID=307972 RepID=A0A2G8LCH2_STIJA|nr:hypothetical protein BSL78_05209 [Apostichopus japonicus]
MANRRPQIRRLAPSWGLSAVLHALAGPPYEPMANASLAALTKKTLFLVAVASARRRSCLHALSTKQNHIRFEGHGVRMVPDPSFIAKNQTLTFLPGDIFIPEIKTMSSVAEDKRWCPVRALKWYLNKTEKLRQSTSLFYHTTTTLRSGLQRHSIQVASRDHTPVHIGDLPTKGSRRQRGRGLYSPIRRHPGRGHTQSSSVENSNYVRRLLLDRHFTRRSGIW